MNDDFLDGWTAVPLGRLLGPGGLFDGPFGSNLKTSDYVDEGVRVVRLENLGYLEFKASKRTFISRRKYQSLARHTVGEGDIMFGSFIGDDVRVCVLPTLDTRAIAKADCFCLRPNKELADPRFLAYFLASPFTRESLVKEIHGATRPRINTTQLKKLSVSLAPREEQKRLVARMDEVIAKVRLSRDRLDKIAIILERFRQAVLNAACEGRLTADWQKQNPRLPHANAIVQGIRDRRERIASTAAQKARVKEIYDETDEPTSDDLPGKWRFVKLNKLCGSFDYGSSAKSQPSGKVPVLRMGNIQAGKIDWTDLVYTSDPAEIKSYILQPNTVLFNRTNSPELVGKTGIYRGEKPAIFAGYLIRANPEPELDPEYLNYCLNTTYAKKYCLMVKTDGVSQSNINAQKLGAVEIPFCSIEEQREIVRRIKKLFNLADRLDARYEKASRVSQKLIQSVLAKAFRGELVPTEAELARRAGRSYETAEELLARINQNPARSASTNIRKNGTQRNG